MFVARVTERFNNVVFTVEYDSVEYRALQLVDRMSDGQVYANTEIFVGDSVLVVNVPQFISSPGKAEPGEDSVSHIIVGLIPPSNVQVIPNYSDLVQR